MGPMNPSQLTKVLRLAVAGLFCSEDILKVLNVLCLKISLSHVRTIYLVGHISAVCLDLSLV